jgi:hypothetical protein
MKNSGNLQKNSPIMALLLTGVLLALTLLRITQTPAPMAWDQQFLRYTFSDPYPKFEQGLPQFWLAGLLQINGPQAEIQLNTTLRSIAAAFYLLSAGLLGWSLRGKGGWLNFGLWLALVFCSGFAFLWLSSEPLAGAFLMLFLWAWTKQRPFMVQVIFLVLFGLTKPDLFFVALLVGAYLSFRGDVTLRQKLLSMLALIGLMALALAPGLLQSGPAYLQPDGRSLNSLGQHYASLIAPLQVTQGLPEPWQYYGVYVAPTWGNANSTLTLIASNPSRYLDFLALSMAMSMRRLTQGLMLFFFVIGGVVFKYGLDRSRRALILLFLANFILIFLLAFYHVRYGARFLPLALFAIFSGLDAVERPRLRNGIRLGLVLLLILQIVVLGIPAFSAGYWQID